VRRLLNSGSLGNLTRRQHGLVASVVQQMSTATPSARNASSKPSPNDDLLQRPRMTSAPRVRIEVLNQFQASAISTSTPDKR
jgi:hypothetical protein